MGDINMPRTLTRNTMQDRGKNVCVSIPAHDLELIDDLRELADYECLTQSQYIRRFIRSEKRKLTQQLGSWNNAWGNK